MLFLELNTKYFIFKKYFQIKKLNNLKATNLHKIIKQITI